MNRFTLLVILTIFVTQIGYSQLTFRSGYIVTNERDTITGLVDYREGAGAYKSCDFKGLVNQAIVTYEPGDIIGYGFENDRFYQSREISFKDQPSQTFFIEVIVQGVVSLYEFKNRFFIEKNNGGLHELLNETKEVLVNDQKMLRSSNEYIRTLNMLLFDCEEIRSKIERVEIDEKKLTKLIGVYNRCKGDAENVIFKETKPWSEMNFGVMSGLNISSLYTNKPIGYSNEVTPFEISKSPVFGVAFNLSFPRLTERLSLDVGGFYLKNTYYNHSTFPVAHRTHRNYLTISLQQIKIPFGIRYTFIRNDFIPYLNVGVSSSFNFNTKSNWTYDVERPDAIIEIHEGELLKVNGKQYSLWYGVGIIKSISSKFAIFAEFRYERINDIYEDSNFRFFYSKLDTRVQSFQLHIGVRTK